MNEELVSICTPCYNHEKYLPDYLKGLLSQTYPRMELIIVDDSSTDRSVDVVTEALPLLEEKFERVLFLKNRKNLGINKTCNILFHEAKGKYVKQTASDDIMLPDCISNLVSLMQDNPDVMLGMGNVVPIADGYRFGESYDAENKLLNITELQKNEDLHNSLLWGNIVGVGKLFRRDVFDICGFFDEKLAFEDWDFLLSYTKNHRIAFSDTVVVLYRTSETSLSRYVNTKDKKERKKRFKSICLGGVQILEKHIKDLPEQEIKDRTCWYLTGTYRYLEDYDARDLQKIIIKELKKRGLPLPEEYKRFGFFGRKKFPENQRI